MPQQEATTMNLANQSSSTTNKPAIFRVTVVRPTGLPVVTGDVKFVFDKSTTPEIRPTQRILRETSGAWTLELRGVPAGSFKGKIVFDDVSGTHATSTVDVIFDVVQGPIPTPKPTPSPTATKKPNTDSCRGQIKN
jgi:hypothetical protein